MRSFPPATDHLEAKMQTYFFFRNDVIDLEVYYGLNDRISTHVNDKQMQKSKSAH